MGKMSVEFEVIRHAFSTTQGEAEVVVNGQSIVQYGDDRILNDDGLWVSSHSDHHFIKAALMQYPDLIADALRKWFWLQYLLTNDKANDYN